MLGGEEPGWLAEAGPGGGARGGARGAGGGSSSRKTCPAPPRVVMYTLRNFEGSFCMEGLLPELLLHKA